MKIRCPSRIHGIVQDDGTMEVKCDSRACGAGGGTIVFHYFDMETWDVVRTRKYQDPVRTRRDYR